MAHSFFTPKITKAFLLRVLLIAAITYVVFRFFLLFVYIQGKSMEPTIKDGSMHVCWRLQYLFSPPQRFDIVPIRFAGEKILLLKRVIGLPGETVAYRSGKLYINDIFVSEPHIKAQSSWNLSPRKIAAGTFYVLGDNRSVSMEQHHFGAVSDQRILGKMIW